MNLWLPALGLGTTSVVAIYTLIFAAVLVTDQLPGVPGSAHRDGLNLSQAWKDLHIISTRPHPFNSHANDIVHDFLISRLKPLAAAYPHVHLVDDSVSNASYDQIYFEGSNILVKIDGTEPDLHGAVLFSAHYDSVSTSNGAIDDGISIVSMLQMVAKLSEARSKRTAVFNFNNGEEDGLNGAHAFLQHPWSKLTRTFLNLEGAAAGGRPILFRGTSTKPISAFQHKYVPHPHGTILAGDAFAQGLVRSRTDYSIYWEGGKIEGLDLAFYKGRSSYHTKYDAMPFLRGGLRALWSMMETLDGAGRALLDQGDGEPLGDVVYFDLFGRLMIMFPLASMRDFNVAFLIAVPIILFGHYTWLYLRFTQTTGDSVSGLVQHLSSHKGAYDFSWARFWIALMMAVASQITLTVAHVVLNKYIVYSSAYYVLAVAISLVYLAFAYPLTSLSAGFLTHHPASTSEPNLLLLQLVIFSYLLLLAVTMLLPIGGTYLFSALALCAFLGWAVGAVNDLAFKAKVNDESGADNDQEDHRAEPTEVTPLILTERSTQSTSVNQSKNDRRNSTIWFIQLLLVVPLPVSLFSHIGVVWIDAMSQGIVDGGPVWIVYAALSLITIFLVLPLAPFIPSYPRDPTHALPDPFRRLNDPKNLFRTLSIACIAGGAYTSGLTGILLTSTVQPASKMGFPFSIEFPMKVFFEQRVEVITPWVTNKRDAMLGNTIIDVRPVTCLTGIPYYLDQMIIRALPSAEHGALCFGDTDRTNLMRCSWSPGTDMIPSPGGHESSYNEGSTYSEPNTQYLSKNPWIQSSIHRRSSTSARFWIRGTNTRSCRLYFGNARVAKWHVVGGSPGVQKGYEGFETKKGQGLTELRLWSRTWDREFVVDVDFVEGPQKINGSVACEWAEYESGRVGIQDKAPGATIPAYEEALRFFPKWATLTKLSDGLVEVWSAFEM